MAELYTAEQIGNFLVTERLAIHGISPDVYAQNQDIVVGLVAVAQDASGWLWGVQLMGSRANGYSTLGDGHDTLGSDIDLVIVGQDTSDANAGRKRIIEAAQDVYPDVDAYAAPAFFGLQTEIPADPDAFIRWVDHTPTATASLWSEGVFATPNLYVGRLAAMEVLRAHASDVERYGPTMWGPTYWAHRWAYIGQGPYIRGKLAPRLGLSPEALERPVSDELFDRRAENFGMPRVFRGAYEAERQWLQTNYDAALHAPAFKLYQGVLKELSRR